MFLGKGIAIFKIGSANFFKKAPTKPPDWINLDIWGLLSLIFVAKL